MPLDVFPMFAGAEPPPNVTLCSLSNVNITAPPTRMSTENGENVLDVVAVTAAFMGGGLVTVIVMAFCTVVEPAVAVAVMVALPADTPVTTPVDAFTVAMPRADEFHVTDAAIGALAWSRGLPVSVMVAPTATVLLPVMSTLLSTGGGVVTVMTDVPVFVTPPAVAVAVMVAVPADTPRTTPVALTVATDVADELHVTVAAIGVPFSSLGLAIRVALPPVTIDWVAGVTVKDVRTGVTGGAVTVSSTALVTVTPPASADDVIVAVPTATAVMRPVDALTLAIAAADELHVTAAAMALPFWSLGAAVSCTVAPTSRLVDGAEMETDVSTGTGGAAVMVISVLADTLLPPALAVAVTVTVPAASALTRPLPLTAATEADEVVHDTVAAMTPPFWSFGLALS